MKRSPILLAMILALISLDLFAQRLQRLPLQKREFEVKSPMTWAKRVIKIDPKTNKEITYDPKPKIEWANAKAGKYNLKWIGYDGKEKVIVFQRPDCVDVVVSAMTIMSKDTYQYKYNVKSLATSGDYLSGFAVENFSTNILPKRPSVVENVMLGNMSTGAFAFMDTNSGNWIRFAPLPPHPKILAGKTIQLTLFSPSLPGLVRCRVNGGKFGTLGVGEDIPGELGESLGELSYEAWPIGYTIGPVDKLFNLSKSERAKYVLELLPQFQKLGWMTAKAGQQYEKILGNQDLEGAYKRAELDLKVGAVTSEVLSILQGLQTK